MSRTFSPTEKEKLKEIIRELAQPKTPIETEVEPKLISLSDIKAVLFDVYGTILVSGTEPMEKKEGRKEELAMQDSWDDFKIDYEAEAPQKAAALLHRKIDEVHAEKRNIGIDYPEVDIIEILEHVMSALQSSGDIKTYDAEIIPELVVNYVVRYDQPWIMPGLQKTLDALQQKEIERGIISNSQFYSPLTLEALCKKDLDEMGFDTKLCYWSYAEDIAKPSVRFYEIAKKQLMEKHDFQPEQVLFVGNDMLNDVFPAHAAGFKTALFAGDIRSLRLREDDERCKNLQPDITITELEQILECV